MRIGNQATKRPIARLWACRLLPRSPNAVATFSLFKDRKSTRLNSSHSQISYAVFCLKQRMSARSAAGAESGQDSPQVDPNGKVLFPVGKGGVVLIVGVSITVAVAREAAG